MKKKIYINGYFTKEHINGVPRYASEIVKRLDRYFEDDEVVLCVPKDAPNIPVLRNIKVCTWEERGKKHEMNNVLWGNITYKNYVKNKGINVNLTNRAENIQGSITAIHDLISLTKFQYGFKLSIKDQLKTAFYYIKNKLWFVYKVSVKKDTASAIVTVSEFSKQQICKKLNIDESIVHVIGDGWEHINNIQEFDEKKDERISPQSYFFFIGNVNPHKNMKWILNEAKNMPEELFVIAGKIPPNIKESIPDAVNNIIFLGYISDGYMKFLMRNSKALLFPSLVEGFGIPPLEQLALNGKAIVADIPVMHEIFKDSVYYVDPYKSDYDLNQILKAEISNGKDVLKENSWELSAEKWYKLIEKYRQE